MAPRRWLQTRPLEMQTGFSDEAHRELSNGGYVPGQSCKEEGFLDFLSAPNRARILSHWLVQKYLHGVSELSEAQVPVELGPRMTQEPRGSPELQNGGLRALEDA